MKMFVFSRALQQGDFPDVTIVSENAARTVNALRKKPGKDIWLFGGSSLFSSLLNEGLVDTIEVAVIPVLLGEGIPLMLPSAPQTRLKLTGHKIYGTGIVSLEYAIRKPRKKRPQPRT
jgi:dihydrofolate reductase